MTDHHRYSYRDALAWLFGTQLFGIKLGLENVHRLLRALNLPSPVQRIIHVAGTNGKGSTCAMIDSILRAQGYRTGLFTSPHLVTFRERIQVDGELISEDAVAHGLTIIRELVAEWDPHPTFFEIVTALGLLHFKNEGCEFVVLETGMGGRLDATNAVTPIVSVITPIDLDHQKWLGDSLGQIAAEKAGIIKPRVPVVSAPQTPEAEAVIRARAKECNSFLTLITDQYAGEVALTGRHQKSNAALALAALLAAEVEISDQALAAGLTSVRWPARFQRWNERIVIDGAHNPAGARVLVEAWREAFGKEKATTILGVMRDKNAEEICRILRPIAERYLLPSFRGERVLPPGELAKLIPNTSYQVATTPAEALSLAQSHPSRILVAGSLHLAGEVLAQLHRNPGAFEECAQ